MSKTSDPPTDAEVRVRLSQRIHLLRSQLAEANATLQSEFFNRVTYKTERNNALAALEQLRLAAKMLAQMAMTSGGTAGPDPDLIRAIEGVTSLLPIEGADVVYRRTLESRAAKALITWRKRWERHSEPPDENGGWTDTMDIWRLAGLLIKDDKEKNRREAATTR